MFIVHLKIALRIVRQSAMFAAKVISTGVENLYEEVVTVGKRSFDSFVCAIGVQNKELI